MPDFAGRCIVVGWAAASLLLIHNAALAQMHVVPTTEQPVASEEGPPSQIDGNATPVSLGPTSDNSIAEPEVILDSAGTASSEIEKSAESNSVMVRQVENVPQSVEDKIVVEVGKRFNDLQSEILDREFNFLNLWLIVIAALFTLATIVPVGFMFIGYDRFREMKQDAQEAVQNAQEAVKAAWSAVQPIRGL